MTTDDQLDITQADATRLGPARVQFMPGDAWASVLGPYSVDCTACPPLVTGAAKHVSDHWEIEAAAELALAHNRTHETSQP